MHLILFLSLHANRQRNPLTTILFQIHRDLFNILPAKLLVQGIPSLGGFEIGLVQSQRGGVVEPCLNQLFADADALIVWVDDEDFQPYFFFLVKKEPPSK